METALLRRLSFSSPIHPFIHLTTTVPPACLYDNKFPMTSRAVVKPVSIPVSNHTAVLDQNITPTLLRLIQNTIRDISDCITNIRLVVCHNGKFLRLTSTSIRQFLVAIIRMRVSI
jgi:hypothetical protein